MVIVIEMIGITDPIIASSDLVLLALRVIFGAAMIMHGYPILSGQVRKQIETGMKQVGVPPALSTLTKVLELVGGIAVIIGFLTPLAGILFALEMVTATWLQRNKFSKKYIGGYELDILYLGAAIVFVLVGAGSISVDGLLP